MKISDKRISKLLKQVNDDSKRKSHEAEIELLRIVEENGYIKKEICTHPDFADVDCDEYNMCKLCGEAWDV